MKVKSKPGKKAIPAEILGKRVPGDYPWKILGWLTDDLRQFLSIDELTRLQSIIRSRDLEEYWKLSEDWGLQSTLQSCTEPWKFAAKYQLAVLLKKFQFATDKDLRRQSAIEKFASGEASCKAFNQHGYTALSVAKEEWMVEVFTYAQSFLQKLLGFELPDLGVLTDRSRHGPGATTGTEGPMVSSYFKFEAWPYHCTARAYGMARRLIQSDERWLGALEDSYRERNDIPKHRILSQQAFWANVIEIVPGNRIAFAPKDARTERTIAIEPTLNVYLQLGVDGFIRRRLKRWGVDLDSQEKNKELARLGSITGVYCTLDLANASNTISRKLCELLLPRDWYDLLMDLRSPQGDLEGLIFPYEMMSSMGNGYTFALESAIFTAVIYAVQKTRLGRFYRDSFAVFGDDLIVTSDIVEDVVTALTSCGFRINDAKSFCTGFTRESCGTDWYRGRPLRPVFLDTIPKTVDELFCDYNRIKRNLCLRFGIEEGRVLRGIYKWIPEEFRDFMGPYSNEDFASYIHWACPVRPFRGSVYTFRRLYRTVRRLKGRNFLFRKLMHDLHPHGQPLSKWVSGRRLRGVGGDRKSVV